MSSQHPDQLRVLLVHMPYRGASLVRKRNPLGPYCRPLRRVLRGSWGGARFVMGEVPLYALCCLLHPVSANLASCLPMDLISTSSADETPNKGLAASEPRWNYIKGFRDFYLRVKEKIWP